MMRSQILSFTAVLVAAAAATNVHVAEANPAKVSEAQDYRRSATKVAMKKLETLITQLKDGEDLDEAAAEAVKRWMFFTPDASTMSLLNDLVNRMSQNNGASARVVAHPDADPIPCGARDIACKKPGENLIYLTKIWADAGTMCRGVVMTHEYFHVIGLHDQPKGTKTSKTSEAMRYPDYLAGLACELSLGISGDTCDYPCGGKP
jgi:hypothetical protein